MAAARFELCRQPSAMIPGNGVAREGCLVKRIALIVLVVVVAWQGYLGWLRTADDPESLPRTRPAPTQRATPSPAAATLPQATFDPPLAEAGSPSDDPNAPQVRAFARIEAEGVVARILPDDTRGSRHERFIVRMASGRTLLISHNIDLAPRIANLAVGDTVRFAGEFVENDKGGIVHWTHHDPAGRHPGGFIIHQGRTYQ